MKVNIELETSESRTFGHCFYYEEEYTLEYKIDFFIKTPIINGWNNFLLIYDTMTIVFDQKRYFISFDVYTNAALWTFKESIEVPTNVPKGFFKVDVEPQDDSNRYSYDFFPSFEYSKDGIVKVIFAETTSNFYQISNNLIVGITEDQISYFYYDLR